MIYISKELPEPLYLQIYNGLKKEILEGVRMPGEILEGTRRLAKTLNVSRNTTDHAYEQLLTEGYIDSRRGIGYVINEIPRLSVGSGTSRAQLQSATARVQAAAKVSVKYDLTNSSHTSDLFPKNLWRRYTLEGLEQLEQESRLSAHLDKQGEIYLRSRLLSYLERIRGVHCSADQIVITCGIQQSLDYICRLLPESRPVILMEEPGFDKAAAVFHNSGRVVRTVPVDEDGLITATLNGDGDICAVYSTPSHQFPTGVTMPVGRRYELLEWASQNDCYIIEDDFDSEQRYYAKPIPALQSIDQQNRVIYLGTFSKGLSPSIRMGYMILPPDLLDQYRQTFASYNSTVPLLNQYVIGRLLETGQYDRHIRRLNHIFRKRLELFLEAFEPIKDKVRITGNRTGQYFLMEFLGEVTQQELIDRAMEQGVQVYSTMQFWHDKAECPPNTLFLGFSKISMEDIPDCAARLQTAWKPWL
ncbi:MAG: PLP-dependent aminotransferase family protein [Lachnospiraceae bacterium]